jgi:cytidine deaminase
MNDTSRRLAVEEWRRLAEHAWACRARAYILGTTRVGAAALADDGQVFVGCNVEHRYRSHDIHAEVNAIGSMVAAGRTALRAILIVAERERFTPCGACMDWIFQFGGPRCFVAYQSRPGGEVKVFTAEELMPYYPM